MAKKTIIGKVVSTSQKTIGVLHEYNVKHPKYLKLQKKIKKYLVHDEKESAKIDDIVEIIETVPVSKNKRFELLRIIEEK